MVPERHPGFIPPSNFGSAGPIPRLIPFFVWSIISLLHLRTENLFSSFSLICRKRMIPRGHVVLRKLLSLRFCGYFPLFIQSLLVNRTFCVRVEGTLSPSFDQVESVPQRGVRSVLCFVLAINDIVTTVRMGLTVPFT